METPKLERSRTSKAKKEKKATPWKKSQWYHNRFQSLLATSTLTLCAIPSLEKEEKKKRNRFLSKGAPEDTQRRPIRPLVPHAQARPFHDACQYRRPCDKETALSPG